MRVISSEKRPIKMWLDYLEDGAEAQAKNLANLPFTFRHVAVMPDGHQGYGALIGSVFATDGVIIPMAVGVDIGCGMCALKTNLTELDIEDLKKIMGQVRETIPVGKNHQKDQQDLKLMPLVGPHVSILNANRSIVDREFASATKQIGTLGGGNHFIEIQRGSDGHIWIMIHSGSRNLGKKVADHYNKLAKELNAKWASSVPPSWDLAFLPLNTDEGQMYQAEMNYCVEFALANRKLMMQRCLEAFNGVLAPVFHLDDDTSGGMINIAHNYAAYENHFGKNVIVHRKGATRARDGEIGIIPGSQGTKSYIVRGKGNPESFQSCSHGAGRKLSRAKARETLDLKAEIARLDAAGVVHGIRHQADLDEAAGAYKSIDEVMANQVDLVDIVIELTPMGVVKE
jgi:tRNA-splicing ligase RtcB